MEGGTLDPEAALDRNWKDTWHLGAAVARHLDNKVYTLGVSYDSSPVSDNDRTIDLPMDYQLRLSAGLAVDVAERLDYALGATLMYGGDASVDQTSQNVRFKGDFDSNLVVFIGASVRYVF